MSAGTIATQAGNQQALPVARGNYWRQSQVGTNWNEVRVGMLYQIVPNGATDGASVAETVTAASYLDWMAFGLMNTRTDSSLIPGVAGVNFIGLLGNTTNASSIANHANTSALGYINGDYARQFCSAEGTSILTKSSSLFGQMTYAQYSSSTYASMFGIRYVVANKGAANQTVTAYTCSCDSGGTEIGPFAITQTTAISVLRSRLMNDSFSDSASLTWNASGAAITLPDCFFVRLPFYNNLLRMAAHDVMLIS